jgi:hypothetical protein
MDTNSKNQLRREEAMEGTSLSWVGWVDVIGAPLPETSHSRQRPLLYKSTASATQINPGQSYLQH